MTTIEQALAEALRNIIEPSLTYLNMWRFDKRDEDPWPDYAADILATEPMQAALKEKARAEAARSACDEG